MRHAGEAAQLQPGERQAGEQQDQQHQRRKGAEEIDPGHQRPAHQRVTHAGEQRQDQAAEQAERHHDQRQQDGVAAGRPAMIGQAAAMISGLKKVCDHRFHANLVSIQRPTTTTGRNSTR